jgi:hypothetical protein
MMEQIYFRLPERVREIIDEDLDVFIYKTMHKPTQDRCIESLNDLFEYALEEVNYALYDGCEIWRQSPVDIERYVDEFIITNLTSVIVGCIGYPYLWQHK